jgi:hypothetical protein
MAILVLVITPTGKDKLFIPDELSTFEGSIAHGGTPAIVPEDAARDYVNKMVDAGFYGEWLFKLVDTQYPCNGESSYKGCKTNRFHEVHTYRSA